MNFSLLNEMIENKYINVQKHPSANLYIYNYAAKTQFERIWNEATLQCRGLIMDADGNIIARPFKKFFNLGEFQNQHIPSPPFEVYEKMDGSLGITYSLNDRIHIATRGSFVSDQAIKATSLLHSKYSHCIKYMNQTNTYLFEIIYPENRIVLDYGDSEMLVLLAIIDKKTGNDLPLEDIGFPIVKKYDGINDLNTIKAFNDDVKEGFVIKYANGYRLKVKFAEYLRLHRIITCVSSVNIWEYLKTGQSMEEILERVPDEFYDWVATQKQSFLSQYKVIESEANQCFKILDSRKETAQYYLTCKHPSILFSMLDGRDYSDIIWKMLRPKYSRPFKNENE